MMNLPGLRLVATIKNFPGETTYHSEMKHFESLIDVGEKMALVMGSRDSLVDFGTTRAARFRRDM